MVRDHTIKPRPAVDTGKTIQQIDQELRELSDSTIERYAASFNPAAIGGKRWEALDESDRRSQRGANELARRSREKEQAAAKATRARGRGLYRAEVWRSGYSYGNGYCRDPCQAQDVLAAPARRCRLRRNTAMRRSAAGVLN